MLRDTHQMLVENSAQVCRILDIFCKKMTVDQNEMLSLKFHFLSYLITQCAKETCDSLLKRYRISYLQYVRGCVLGIELRWAGFFFAFSLKSQAIIVLFAVLCHQNTYVYSTMVR